MRALQLALPVLVVGTWLTFAGCDDTRPVVDVGTGGSPEGGQASAGERASEGGAESLGGAAGGQGGAGMAAQCPSDYFEADGADCSAFGDGFVCSDGGTDPCQFGNSLLCANGSWQREEAFPAPCGGAAGMANAGGAGAVGGDASSAGAGGN